MILWSQAPEVYLFQVRETTNSFKLEMYTNSAMFLSTTQNIYFCESKKGNNQRLAGMDTKKAPVMGEVGGYKFKLENWQEGSSYLWQLHYSIQL